MEDRLNKIIERWFVIEPALFAVTCSHDLVENSRMSCLLRCGNQRIEYNPELLAATPDKVLEEALKAEAIRIILKHPYERKPDQCSQMAVSIGSNMTISDNYVFQYVELEKPFDLGLESGHPYEWYCHRVQELRPEYTEEGGSGLGEGTDASEGGQQSAMATEAGGENFWSDKNTDLSELWEEDDLAIANINGIIENVRSWGSLSGKFAEMIVASTKAKIDWRNIFSGFRASILSSKRKMTRMRPSRRFGFEQMGSQRQFITKLIVAVDVSGSISKETLSYFYGIIDSAFRYGFEAVDVVQFDCGIGKVQSLKKVIKQVEAFGRGGTSFDEPIQYAFDNNYDGLLILTDGYAPQPTLPEGFRTKIMWVCDNQYNYDNNHTWMEQYGRVCVMDLM